MSAVVDDTLLALLACPSPDHAPLERGGTAAAPELVCTVCRSRFPVRDGLPVLLPDDARPGPRGLGVAAPADPPADEPDDEPAGGVGGPGGDGA